MLLLALEILVAADLPRTIAVEPSLRNVTVLGEIVLIRTFLSFSLEIEIEGVPPWRRALVSGATVAGRAYGRARRDVAGAADVAGVAGVAGAGPASPGAGRVDGDA